MTRPSGHVGAGRVGRPHGLDGSFYVVGPDLDLLARGRHVVVAGQRAEVVRRAGTDQRPVVRLAGHSDRSAAERLRGLELLVAREDAPALEEEEWWAEDLEGCRVLDGAREVGVVRRLLALPSCEVLEVDRPGAGPLLVPLVRDAVRAVDPDEKRIDVDLAFLGEGS